MITSDAGLLAYRELDDAVGLTDIAGEVFADARTGKNGQHALVGLLRQSVFGRLAGYEDVNDAERLCRDPAMRWVVGDRAVYGAAASASEMGRFETEWLPRPENLAALADLSGQWIDRVHRRRPPKLIVLDMDSSESPIYGEQEGSAYNGHFGCTCYHPLFVFNQFGDLERCALRPGNVHSAHEWERTLRPVIARYQGKIARLYFRADAAFAMPEVYEFLEAEGIKYTIRLPANRVLQDKIGHLLSRPVGRPPTVGHDRLCCSRNLVCRTLNAGIFSDAGLLHDIGKLAIPLELLRKSSALSSEERALIRTHAAKGYEILFSPDDPFIEISGRGRTQSP